MIPDPMNETQARALLERHAPAYPIADIHLIPEGANHYVFDILLQDGTPLIAKFKKELGAGAQRRDSLYGGLVSLERESAIYRLVREKASLAGPKIYVKHESAETSFLLVEKLGGVLWRKHLQRHNYSRECFLRSLEYLGEDIARLQRITFPSFGDVMGGEAVSPSNVDNFGERFNNVMQMRLDRASRRRVFTGEEIERLRHFFVSALSALSGVLSRENTQPVMVLTDLHADNFLVDETGRPSGYFDLESCQAAHPALEFYGLKLFLFNYFDGECFNQAEESFFAGFERVGGAYDRSWHVNAKLETLLAAGRVLELSESYFEYRDGLRDSWSSRFKALLWQALEFGRVDYLAAGDIFREKTGQPRTPN